MNKDAQLTTERNASANIFKWNDLECKCRHFQMQQLDKHSKNQIQKMKINKCNTFHISVTHSTSFQASMSISQLTASEDRFAQKSLLLQSPKFLTARPVNLERHHISILWPSCTLENCTATHSQGFFFFSVTLPNHCVGIGIASWGNCQGVSWR